MPRYLTEVLVVLLASATALAAPVPKSQLPDPTGRSYFDLRTTESFSVDDNGTRTDFLTAIVVDGGVMEKCGFKNGDIIRKIGNDDVYGHYVMWRKIEMYRPGSVVEFTVERDKELVKIKVVMEERNWP